MGEKPQVGVGFGVLILNNRKQILLGKRNTGTNEIWTMPAGRINFSEGLEEAAARKTQAETGLVVDLDHLKIISLSNDIMPDSHYVTVGFRCTDFTGEPRVIQPEKMKEWKWFELDGLPQPLFKPSAEIIENFLHDRLYQR